MIVLSYLNLGRDLISTNHKKAKDYFRFVWVGIKKARSHKEARALFGCRPSFEVSLPFAQVGYELLYVSGRLQRKTLLFMGSTRLHLPMIDIDPRTTLVGGTICQS